MTNPPRTMYMVAPNHEGETALHAKNLPGGGNIDLHPLTRPVYKKRVGEPKISDSIKVLPGAS